MLVRPFLLLFPVLVAGQALAADVMFPTGSRVGLIPPSGMVRSTNFPGFVDFAKKAAILIGEFPAGAYAEVEKGLIANALKPGFATESREPVTLHDGKGLLIVGRQDSQGLVLRRWLLVAETGGLTALVSVEIQSASVEAKTDAAIRAALDSLAVRTVVPSEELLTLLPYNLKDLAGFRIVQAAPNGGAMLTDGPKDSVELAEQPAVIITIIPSVPEPGADRGSFARMALSGVPGVKDLRIQRMEPMRIGGQQGHETMLEGKDSRSDTDVTVVQWLRFGSGSSVRVLALARKADWPKMFPRFRSLRDGFAPK
jgi:hypothetical protein